MQAEKELAGGMMLIGHLLIMNCLRKLYLEIGNKVAEYYPIILFMLAHAFVFLTKGRKNRLRY